AGFLGRAIGTLRYSLGLDFRPPENTNWRPDYTQGTMLRTIQVPFALWINHRKRWLKIGIGMALTGCLAVIVALVAYGVLVDYASQMVVWSPEIGFDLPT